LNVEFERRARHFLHILTECHRSHRSGNKGYTQPGVAVATPLSCGAPPTDIAQSRRAICRLFAPRTFLRRSILRTYIHSLLTGRESSHTALRAAFVLVIPGESPLVTACVVGRRPLHG
jgi:hypothetical protein